MRHRAAVPLAGAVGLTLLLAASSGAAGPAAAPDPLPGRISWDQIKDVVVLQGPDYWWWADSQLTGPAAALVVLLWIGVFVLRRTVRLTRFPRREF